MSFSAAVSATDASTATADSREVILGLQKLVILIELELWGRRWRMGLQELRSGEPVRKVELRWRRWRLVVKSIFFFRGRRAGGEV